MVKENTKPIVSDKQNLMVEEKIKSKEAPAEKAKPVFLGKQNVDQKSEDRLVRILSKDIEGKTDVYSGLTRIKGVAWGMSNAICKVLKLDKRKKIGALSEVEIKKIEEFIKNPKVPHYLINRRKDFETGKDSHLTGTDLDLRKEFDIKRLKKIKSYRGVRHAAGQPVRGQRTRSHFRFNRKKGAGIKSKTKDKKEIKTQQ